VPSSRPTNPRHSSIRQPFPKQAGSTPAMRTSTPRNRLIRPRSCDTTHSPPTDGPRGRRRGQRRFPYGSVNAIPKFSPGTSDIT
jgi:hypothetical protein